MGRAATFDIEAFQAAVELGEIAEDALAVELFGTRIEIKRDLGCWRESPCQGNLAIEYEQQGRPSGLATTTAHRWAFEFDDDCWLILPTQRVRDIARPHLPGIPMGDNGNVGLIIPVENFVRRP